MSTSLKKFDYFGGGGVCVCVCVFSTVFLKCGQVRFYQVTFRGLAYCIIISILALSIDSVR